MGPSKWAIGTRSSHPPKYPPIASRQNAPKSEAGNSVKLGMLCSMIFEFSTASCPLASAKRAGTETKTTTTLTR